MSDNTELVKRLWAPSEWHSHSGDGHDRQSDDPYAAAVAIEVLEARVAELEADFVSQDRRVSDIQSVHVQRLNAEKARAEASEARAERYRVAIIDAQCWVGEHNFIEAHNVLTAALNDTKLEQTS